MTVRRASKLVVLGLLGPFLASCAVQAPAPAPTPTQGVIVLRVGYFPNITHSQALIGIARGDFQKALGPGVRIQPTVFNAGPSEIEALFANQIDLGYIGPNPAVNGFVQSKGVALRVVAGATSGGAELVVRPASGIASAADLAGKRIASPQLGNTQDVALRAYLAAHGLKVAEKGGTVTVVPVDNPQILDLFKLGQIDGAWVPEPWASRLVVEGGGQVLLDERTLWPNGDFTTAVIIVATPFLRAHPEIVRTWLETHLDLTRWEEDNPQAAKDLMNGELARLTGKPLATEVLDMAWQRMRPTYDPLTASIQQSSVNAYQAGYLQQIPDLKGLVDLTLLNQVLRARGLAPID